MFASQVPPRRNPPIITDKDQKKESVWRIFVDIISLIICKSFFVLLEKSKFRFFFLVLAATIISHYVAKPFTRGFFCSDTSIQYPHKDNTIPTSAAVILSIGLPVIWVSYMDI
jgi:hypothetical protein